MANSGMKDLSSWYSRDKLYLARNVESTIDMNPWGKDQMINIVSTMLKIEASTEHDDKQRVPTSIDCSTSDSYMTDN